MSREFEMAVVDLREGRTTYAEFARATRSRWEATAGWLMRRWRVPGWVTVEDVVQDLLHGAWIGVWGYDPGRGSRTAAQHVVYTACDKAKKRMHKLRGARLHGNPDDEPSRILDFPSSLLGEGAERIMDEAMCGPATQEEDATRKQSVRRMLAQCETVEELVTLQALAEAESLEGAVELVYGDEDARRLLRIESAAAAADVVVRVAYALAERFNNGAAQGGAS